MENIRDMSVYTYFVGFHGKYGLNSLFCNEIRLCAAGLHALSVSVSSDAIPSFSSKRLWKLSIICVWLSAYSGRLDDSVEWLNVVESCFTIEILGQTFVLHQAFPKAYSRVVDSYSINLKLYMCTVHTQGVDTFL